MIQTVLNKEFGFLKHPLIEWKPIIITENVMVFKLNRKEFIFITLRYTTKIEENPNLISQFATSSWDRTRKMPYAFTELSIAILNTA